MNEMMISHSSKDKRIAEIISNIIKKISLNTINVWFSSDSSVDGGISCGIWYDTIIHKLDNADILIVILTSNSINNNWVLFETGYMNCKSKNNIFPICIGINIDEITPPISLLQLYDIMNIDKINVFLSRLLQAFNITYDKAIFHEYILGRMDQIRSLINEIIITNEKKDELSEFARLKLYIEDKFNSLNQLSLVKNNFSTYSIQFIKQIADNFLIHYALIEENTRISDILDEVFYKFELEAFTYLEKWILVDSDTKRKLVIREISSIVYAKDVFNKNEIWEVVMLKTPYVGTDSHDNEKLIYNNRL